MDDKPHYEIRLGTIQAYVVNVGGGPYFFEHFGLGEYDRDRPILTEPRRIQAQEIVDKLNAGKITQDQAKAELKKIW